MKNHLKDFPCVLEKIPSNYGITGKSQNTAAFKGRGFLRLFKWNCSRRRLEHTLTRSPGAGVPAEGRMDGAGHASLPGVELISLPFVPGQSFKHLPEPLPLPPGSIG